MRQICVLFDLDGTLTQSRKPAKFEVLQALKELREVAVVGIVSGSDEDKVLSQLGLAKAQLNDFVDWLFFENGTVTCCIGNEHNNHNESIIKFLGEEKLKAVINFALRYIADLDIPIKRGSFVELRNGMLNLSPIGRSCTYDERLQFYELDKELGIRKTFAEQLTCQFASFGMQFAIGGQISIDCFPQGWDKRYCLRHLEHFKFKEIHFFGDRTQPGGNDYELFSDNRVIGHAVESPEETLEGVKKLIASQQTHNGA